MAKEEGTWRTGLGSCDDGYTLPPQTLEFLAELASPLYPLAGG